MDKVSVGRIVRFVASDTEVCAAIVAKVWNESSQCVNLAVVRDNGNVSSFTSILPDPNKVVGTWHWPERN